MAILGKKQMSEEDIKLNYITPVIQRGWKGHITMETKITDGRINIRGNIVARSKPKYADYFLYLNDGKPIAVVEAKDNNHSVSHGLQQAMTYAQMMDLPFAYSSNGDAFYECHRGSAKEDSNWRKVLEYFTSATQIGMTATPKESEKVSNIDYFGEPVYIYSLKQGIEDGFLAPFKVINITTNIGDGWRPYRGQTDIFGNVIEDRIPDGENFKAQKFTAEYLLNEQGCNIDLCGYPHEEEEILDPMDTIREYQERRTTLNAEIDKVLAELEALLPGGVSE